MGIPKFYRWLSERYPLVNQPIASTNVPEIDNLYLDMNGIIHNCTHGNDPNVKLTEEEMIAKVFTYLDKLFQIVQPQRLLFAAIDGCAPRAKMNQQRGRRFKAAKEAAENKAKQERENPEEGPQVDAFDSNCITPGTPFMGRLAEHLRFFFRRKIEDDPAWQRPTIIFSGHDVPGEGEHKIMEHIRWAKRQPGYEPNQRHCLYGLDADLIMLSLVTHEPHFCLLREVVSFASGQKGQPSREVLVNPGREHFILFQIGLLREYMDLEFRSANLPFPFDIERFVDDFVLFCMLIGNDFLPTLPTLDVNEGALDKIFAIYKELLPQMGGYLTNAGELNHGRLELLLKRLAALELETLQQRAEDAEYFESKKTRGGGGFGRDSNPSPVWRNGPTNSSNGPARNTPLKNNGFRALMEGNELDEETLMEAEMAALGGQLGPAQDLALLEALEDPKLAKLAEPTMMSREARALVTSGDPDALQKWKDRYYREKLGIDPADPTAKRTAVEAYIQGLHWVLEYYYRGVVSWGWFYPYHYSPMISDMADLETMRTEFELGQPFTPYQQLLAVLPAASHKLLPKPYQWLMTDAKSPIADFYPLNFQLDTEGKRQEWEAVVVLEFIDVPQLRAAEGLVPLDSLSQEERDRNQRGPLLHFTHAPGSNESAYCASTLPARIPSVMTCNSRCEPHDPLPPIPAGEPGFKPELVPGTQWGEGGPPGFPTMRSLDVTPELKMAHVEVLGQPSKRESLVLAIKATNSPAGQGPLAGMVAGSILGQRVWIKWPYLQEAIIQAVSDTERKVDKDLGDKPHDQAAQSEWHRAAAELSNQFRSKQGLDVGACHLVLHVRPCEGLMRQLDGSIEKRFSKTQLLYPIQATLRQNTSPDPRLDISSAEQRIGRLMFPEGSKALFLGRAHYGCVATVLASISAPQGVENGTTADKLRVSIELAPIAGATAAATAKRLLNGMQVSYQPSYGVARRLGVSPRSLGRITGSVFVRAGDKKFDLGLCIKNAPKGLCVPDYVRPQPEGKGWAYSEALLQALSKYKARYQWVFKMLDDSNDERGDIDAAQLFPDLTPEEQLQRVQDARRWLDSQPLARRVLVKATTQVVPEQAIRALQAALPAPSSRKPESIELSNVAPALLLPPADTGGLLSELSGGVFELGNRVAFLGRNGPQPLGARGTVVGVHEDACEVLFDAPFPGGTDLHGRCAGSCGAVLPSEELLNLSHPHAVAATGADAPTSTKAAARAPSDPQTPQKSAAWNGTNAGVAEAGWRRPGATPEAASPARAPPPGLGVGRARTPPARGAELPGEDRMENGKARAAVQRARRPLDPQNNLQKGFSLGRGRSISGPSAPPANLHSALVDASPAQPAPGSTANGSAGGGPLPAGTGMVADGQQKSRGYWPPEPLQEGTAGSQLLRALQAGNNAVEQPATAQPPTVQPQGSSQGSMLLRALQGGGMAPQMAGPPVDHDHKVHRGMGAAIEILRASQQNLAAMDTESGAPSAPTKNPAAPAPEAAGAHNPGNRLLSLLQGGGPAGLATNHAQASASVPGPAAATPFAEQPGTQRSSANLADWMPLEALPGQPSLLQWLRRGSSTSSPQGSFPPSNAQQSGPSTTHSQPALSSNLGHPAQPGTYNQTTAYGTAHQSDPPSAHRQATQPSNSGPASLPSDHGQPALHIDFIQTQQASSYAQATPFGRVGQAQPQGWESSNSQPLRISGATSLIGELSTSELLALQGPAHDVSVSWEPAPPSSSSALEAAQSELMYWDQLSQQTPARPSPPAAQPDNLSSGGNFLDKLRQGSAPQAAARELPGSSVPPGSMGLLSSLRQGIAGNTSLPEPPSHGGAQRMSQPTQSPSGQELLHQLLGAPSPPAALMQAGQAGPPGLAPDNAATFLQRLQAGHRPRVIGQALPHASSVQVSAEGGPGMVRQGSGAIGWAGRNVIRGMGSGPLDDLQLPYHQVHPIGSPEPAGIIGLATPALQHLSPARPPPPPHHPSIGLHPMPGAHQPGPSRAARPPPPPDPMGIISQPSFPPGAGKAPMRSSAQFSFAPSAAQVSTSHAHFHSLLTGQRSAQSSPGGLLGDQQTPFQGPEKQRAQQGLPGIQGGPPGMLGPPGILAPRPAGGASLQQLLARSAPQQPSGRGAPPPQPQPRGFSALGAPVAHSTKPMTPGFGAAAPARVSAFAASAAEGMPPGACAMHTSPGLPGPVAIPQSVPLDTKGGGGRTRGISVTTPVTPLKADAGGNGSVKAPSNGSLQAAEEGEKGNQLTTDDRTSNLPGPPQASDEETVSASFADLWKSLEAEHVQEASAPSPASGGTTNQGRRGQRASPKGRAQRGGGVKSQRQGPVE